MCDYLRKQPLGCVLKKMCSQEIFTWDLKLFINSNMGGSPVKTICSDTKKRQKKLEQFEQPCENDLFHSQRTDRTERI